MLSRCCSFERIERHWVLSVCSARLDRRHLNGHARHFVLISPLTQFENWHDADRVAPHIWSAHGSSRWRAIATIQKGSTSTFSGAASRGKQQLLRSRNREQALRRGDAMGTIIGSSPEAGQREARASRAPEPCHCVSIRALHGDIDQGGDAEPTRSEALPLASGTHLAQKMESPLSVLGCPPDLASLQIAGDFGYATARDRMLP